MKKSVTEKEKELEKLITEVGDKLVERITESGRHRALKTAVENFKKS